MPEDFELPEVVDFDPALPGGVSDITAADAHDAELAMAVRDAWEAFHPGEDLPPPGTLAEFNAEHHAFNEALREQAD